MVIANALRRLGAYRIALVIVAHCRHEMTNGVYECIGSLRPNRNPRIGLGSKAAEHAVKDNQHAPEIAIEEFGIRRMVRAVVRRVVERPLEVPELSRGLHVQPLLENRLAASKPITI
jgi:hypothetical protein